MRPKLRHAVVAVALAGALGCGEAPPPSPVPVTVLASASLAELATEAGEAFEVTANAVVEVRSAGTDELAAELSSGTAADLFLATGLDSMDRLEREGLIVPGSRWEAVSNRMVIVGREEADYPPVRFVNVASLGFRRFVVPDPSRDPAGRYARRWLQNVGLRGESVWRQVEPRRETVDNVGQVVEAVASDPATVGVAFSTDVTNVPSGTVLFRSPDLGIRYSFALVNRPGRPPEAAQLLEYLRSPAGIELLERNGFLTDP